MISVFEAFSRQCRASSSRFALRPELMGFGAAAATGFVVTVAAEAGADAGAAAGLGAGAAAAGLGAGGGVSGSGVAVGPDGVAGGVAGAGAGLSWAKPSDANTSAIRKAKVLMSDPFCRFRWSFRLQLP